jgi:TolA-binding protein
MGNLQRKFWLRFTTGEGQDGGGPDPGEGQEFTPITSQEDLNKVIQDRVSRERKKFADYKDLKAKADELDRLKSENQTAEDKAAQQLADMQKRIDEMTLTTLRAKVQASHGISDADADLFLTGTDEDTLTRQAKALADRDKDRKKKGPVVPTQGNHPTKTGGDEALREFTRGVFGRTD